MNWLNRWDRGIERARQQQQQQQPTGGNRMGIVIGIDNGLDGGVVMMLASGNALRAYVTPTLGKGKRSYDLVEMRRILLAAQMAADGDSVLALLERAQAMPKQGVSSTFSTGNGYGMWQGLLAGMQIPFEIVSPQKWQGEMFVGINRADTKAASALVAQRLRPDQDWRASVRCRKPHDGLTDAFCIAEYGRRRAQSERAA